MLSEKLRQHRQDSVNLVKIERYFRQYGHPVKTEVGELAAQTPWAVIHHANSYEARTRNFDFLYQAYERGDIDDSAMSMFLGRMYNMKFRKRWIMEGPYQAEDEINQLIEALELKKADL